MSTIEYFTNRLQCFVQGKMEALNTVKKVCSYAHIAKTLGILALGKSSENESDIFLKTCLTHIVDAIEPSRVVQYIENYTLSTKCTGNRFLEIAIIAEGCEMIQLGFAPRQIASMLEGWFSLGFAKTYRNETNKHLQKYPRLDTLVPFFLHLDMLDDDDLKRLCKYSDPRTTLSSIMDTQCTALRGRIFVLISEEDPWQKKQVDFQEAGTYKINKNVGPSWRDLQDELKQLSENEIRSAQIRLLDTARTLCIKNRMRAIPYREKSVFDDGFKLWGEEMMDADYIDMEYYTQRLQCTHEEKMACLETVRKLYSYGVHIRVDGFLAVESELEKETDIFLKKGMMCLVDYMNKRLTRKALTNYLVAEDCRGGVFLNKVLVIEGVGMIQDGINPRFMLELLEGWFGNDFVETFDQEIVKIEEAARKKALERAEEDLNDRLDKDSSIWIGFDSLRALVDVEIQRLLRDVDSKDLSVALKGAAQDVTELVLGNVSPKMKEAILLDMDSITKLRARDVEDAQKKIIRVAEMLDKAGEIALVRIDI